MWKIRIHRRVRKWLKKHPIYEDTFWDAVRELGRNPYVGVPLRGRCRGFYKWKKKGGDLRIMYVIDKKDKFVFIEAIGLRENFYEKYC